MNGAGLYIIQLKATPKNVSVSCLKTTIQDSLKLSASLQVYAIEFVIQAPAINTPHHRVHTRQVRSQATNIRTHSSISNWLFCYLIKICMGFIQFLPMLNSNTHKIQT